MITPYITDAGYGNLQAKIVSCRARAGVFLVADPAFRQTFVWAGAIIGFTAFTYFAVPETKGLRFAALFPFIAMPFLTSPFDV